jgi:hypothetical protein
MHRGRGFDYGDYHDGPWFWIFRFGFMLLVFALLGLLVAYLVRSLRRPSAALNSAVMNSSGSVGSVPAAFAASAGSPGGPAVGPLTKDDAAVAHVRMRYARGEIGREEFLRASADLGVAIDASPPSPPDPAPNP